MAVRPAAGLRGAAPAGGRSRGTQRRPLELAGRIALHGRVFFDDDPSDFPADEFRFGLDLILDGVEKIAVR